jgi:tRNA (guanosine-2'-O-)-methyltransferase
MLDQEEQQRLLFEGGYPVLANVAKRKRLPRPHIDEQGQVVADAEWWATMQATVRK